MSPGDYYYEVRKVLRSAMTAACLQATLLRRRGGKDGDFRSTFETGQGLGQDTTQPGQTLHGDKQQQMWFDVEDLFFSCC